MSEKRRREGVDKVFASLSGERRRASESVRRDKRSQLSKRFRAANDIQEKGSRESVADGVGSAAAAAAAAVVQSLPPLQEVCARLSFVGTPDGNEAVGILRQYLSGENAPIKAVLHGGALPHLIATLRVPNESVQRESLWCLTNMATGDHNDTRQVLQAAPELIQLLASGSPSLSEQACWTLGNIAADSDDELKAILLANGVLQPLLLLLNSLISASPATSPCSEARTVAWTISNLARGSTPAEHLTLSGSIPFLLTLTSRADAALAFEVWWIFAFLTAKSEEAVHAMLQQGLAVAVASAASNAVDAIASGLIKPHENAAEIVPILRTLGNLTSGPVEWLDLLLQQPRLLPCLISLASVSNSVVVKDVLAVLRNVLGLSLSIFCFCSVWFIRLYSSDANKHFSPLLVYSNALRIQADHPVIAQPHFTMTFFHACWAYWTRERLM